MTDPIEAMARGLCEQHIRNVRRHDTTPERLEEVLPSAVDYSWHDFVDAATAAYAALRKTLVPVGWRYTKLDALDAGIERRALREFQVADAVGRGWTETPLYALPEIKP